MPRWWISIVCSGLAGVACGEREQPQPAGEPAVTAVAQEVEPLTLHFESTEEGLFFTVKTKAGKVLAERLDMDAVVASHPELISSILKVPISGRAQAAKPHERAMNAGLAPAALHLEDSDALFGLETRNHVLYIHSTDFGTLYTVESKDGRVLAEGLTEVELGIRYPELHAIVLDGVDLIATGADETYR